MSPGLDGRCRLSGRTLQRRLTFFNQFADGFLSGSVQSRGTFVGVSIYTDDVTVLQTPHGSKNSSDRASIVERNACSNVATAIVCCSLCP